MRSTLRVLALVLVLLAIVVPLTSFAQDGPCPDDPVLSADCNQEAPPFYVVINRSFEDLTRPGTGCQPIILNNPDCVDCCGEDAACIAADNQVVEEVCPMLAGEVDWVSEGQTEIVYELCCNCVSDPAGIVSACYSRMAVALSIPKTRIVTRAFRPAPALICRLP
jgi:hypothetical protein